MNQLQVIVHRQARVLTTGQLAESYGAEEKLVQQNFNNNKTRYKEGKHFFLLQGEELRAFKRDFESLGFAPNLNKLYLWTEKGAWLHAKSLNTDAAWDAYEMLVDEYYKVIEQQQAQDPVELALQTSLKNYQEIKGIKEDVNYLKDSMRIDGIQQKAIQSAAKGKAIDALGGFDTKAYKDLSGKAFRSIWKEFNTYFQLPRYGELPKSKYNDALYFISKWRPSAAMEIEIEACNRQENFHLVD